MTDKHEVVTLHEIDQQLRSLESGLEEAKADAVRARQEAESLRQVSERVQRQLQEARAKAASNEKEQQALDEKIAERHERTRTAQTHQEYQAVLTEIDTLRSEKSELEQRAEANLSEIETLETEVERVAEALEQARQLEQAAEARLTERRTEHDDRVGQLRRDREQAADKLSAMDLRLYDQLFDDCDGEPLAALEEQSRRHMEFTCSGCFMLVPIERINRLLSGTGLSQCPSCSRILYPDSDLRSSLVKDTASS